MAQLLVLILVSALCAYTQASVKLKGEPFNCTVNEPVPGKAPLIDFERLTYNEEGYGFQGSIDILATIVSDMQLDIYVIEEDPSGSTIFSHQRDLRNICETKNYFHEDYELSFFFKRIFAISDGSGVCIKAKQYDMRGVILDQHGLQSFKHDSTITIEFEFETLNEYTCFAISGDVYTDTQKIWTRAVPLPPLYRE